MLTSCIAQSLHVALNSSKNFNHNKMIVTCSIYRNTAEQRSVEVSNFSHANNARQNSHRTR